MTVYSLIANGDQIGTRNLANFYDGVLIVSSIGLKDGQLLMIDLCTLAWPYKIPGWHPTGEIFLYIQHINKTPFIMKAFKNVFNMPFLWKVWQGNCQAQRNL